MSASLQQKVVQAQAETEAISERIRAKKKKIQDTTRTRPMFRDCLVLAVCDDNVSALPALTLRPRRLFKGHLGRIYAAEWLRAGHQFISAAQDGRVLIWDATTGLKVHCLNLHSVWVMCCSASDSGRLVATGGLDDICSVYRRRDGAQVDMSEESTTPSFQLRFHEGYISKCKFVNEGELVTSSGDGTCAFWDIEREQVIQVFKGHKSDVLSLALTPDRRSFISVGSDATARLWDLRLPGTHSYDSNQVNMVRQMFVGHDGDVCDVQVMHNGYTFATASEDSSCRIFDIRTDAELQKLFHPITRSTMTSVAFSASGRALFCGSDDGNIYAWDVLLGKRIGVLSGHDSGVCAVAVAPGGDALCSASWDGQIKLWA